MPKSPDAFRTISEVAEWLGVNAHVLRFWESKFSQVKPVKRGGGRRYYRPADMLLLGGIKKLLHEDGLTIKGVQKLLREHGVPHVADHSQALDDLTIAEIGISDEAGDDPQADVSVEPDDLIAPETNADDSPPLERSADSNGPAPEGISDSLPEQDQPDLPDAEDPIDDIDPIPDTPAMAEVSEEGQEDTPADALSTAPADVEEQDALAAEIAPDDALESDPAIPTPSGGAPLDLTGTMDATEIPSPEDAASEQAQVVEASSDETTIDSAPSDFQPDTLPDDDTVAAIEEPIAVDEMPPESHVEIAPDDELGTEPSDAAAPDDDIPADASSVEKPDVEAAATEVIEVTDGPPEVSDESPLPEASPVDEPTLDAAPIKVEETVAPPEAISETVDATAAPEAEPLADENLDALAPITETPPEDASPVDEPTLDAAPIKVEETVAPPEAISETVEATAAPEAEPLADENLDALAPITETPPEDASPTEELTVESSAAEDAHEASGEPPSDTIDPMSVDVAEVVEASAEDVVLELAPQEPAGLPEDNPVLEVAAQEEPGELPPEASDIEEPVAADQATSASPQIPEVDPVEQPDQPSAIDDPQSEMTFAPEPGAVEEQPLEAADENNEPDAAEQKEAAPSFIPRARSTAQVEPENAPETEPTTDAPSKAAEDIEDTISEVAPAPAKPRVIDIAPLPHEDEMPAAPAVLSALTRPTTLSPAQQDAAKPLLAQLVRLRSSMVNAHQDAVED